MASDFIDLDVTTDPSAITQVGIDQLQSLLDTNGFPGYVPADGNFEIILLNTIGYLFADVANVAAQVPAAIFRAFGTQLLGLQYVQGAAATVVSTWTLADTLGHTIPAGTFVTISDLGFYVQSDVVVAPGSSSGTVTLVASDQGSSFNGFSGTVLPVDQIDWVLGVVTVGSTSGGTDPQDDLDFENKLAGTLALTKFGVVTSADFAAAVLSETALNATGVNVGRATAIDGYSPANAVFTVTTASGNSAVTVTAAPGPGVLATAGSTISGAGIPGGTTVLSATSSTILMSTNATASASGVSATVAGTSGNERTEAVFVTDTNGNAFPGSSTTSTAGAACVALQSWLAGLRELNFAIDVYSATYTPVYATVHIKPLPGFAYASVVTAVQQAVMNYLSPANWGTAGGTSASLNTWYAAPAGFNVVRYNKLLGIIENVAGVDFVYPGSAGLTLGLSASPISVVDVTLPGQAPLPTSTTSTILVTAV